MQQREPANLLAGERTEDVAVPGQLTAAVVVSESTAAPNTWPTGSNPTLLVVANPSIDSGPYRPPAVYCNGPPDWLLH